MRGLPFLKSQAPPPRPSPASRGGAVGAKVTARALAAVSEYAVCPADGFQAVFALRAAKVSGCNSGYVFRLLGKRRQPERAVKR